jgi:hypothetical protein
MSTLELVEIKVVPSGGTSVPDHVLRHSWISAGGEIALFGTVQGDHLSGA